MVQIIMQYNNLYNSNIDLILVNGNITQLNNVHAIVMPTGSHFQHSGGCSRAIVTAVGPKILSDFTNYLNHNSYLDYGVVFVAQPYNLAQSCSCIFAVKSPDISVYSIRNIPSNGKSLNLLEFTFGNIIHKAFVSLNLTSVATPLIGTGINGISINDCLRDLISSVIDFTKDSQNMNTNINRQIIVIDNQSKNLRDLIKIIQIQHNNFQPVQPQPAQSPQVNTSNKTTNSNTKASDENCVICMEQAGKETGSFAKKLEKCGHTFCNTCIDDYFKNVKMQCPICNTLYGVVYGNQPNGSMTHRVINQSLPGYDSRTKTIQIDYSFPNGTQGANHPNPGKHYSGTSRTAYLPDTTEGKKVLELLKKAFDLKHIFTIGTSRTTGVDNIVTWNDIHHKTSIHGGPSNFGYPDPTYLSRVTNELAAKGIF